MIIAYSAVKNEFSSSPIILNKVYSKLFWTENNFRYDLKRYKDKKFRIKWMPRSTILNTIEKKVLNIRNTFPQNDPKYWKNKKRY